MRRLSSLFRAVLLLATASSALLAQQVRGVVRDTAVGIPVPGVVVTVLDSAGAVGARAITDASGRFTVFAALSAARLRLMRIGYRPRDVSIPAKRDGEMSIGMEKVPPILERVRVSDTELCPGSTDRGAAFQLWEQARAGLLATVVARDLKPANAKTLIYESVMSANDETIRRQKKQIRSGRTTRPFVASAEPDYFARVGYMLEDQTGRLFNAPDADVLLHESFATTHCFRIRTADAEHPGQMGIAFAPIAGRDTLVDVSGVIWMDATAGQLRSLDFGYTSLEPPAQAVHPGGHIEFRSMPNGASFIERWALRLPNLQPIPNPVGSHMIARGPARRIERRERMDVRVVEIIEAGGIVVDARWDDSTAWVDTPAIAAGIVKQKKSGDAVADAIVTLVGTADTTVTDNAGEFEIQAIPGRYLVQVADTALQAFAKPRVQTIPVVVSRTAVLPVQVDLPAVGDIVADVCRGQKMREASLILTGYVAMSDASSVAGTQVRAAWQSDYSQFAGPVTVSSATQEVDVDDDGRFVVCGVTRERPINLRLFKGSNKLADTTFRIFTVGLTHRVLWLAAPPTIAVASATLEGTVMSDAAKTPIVGAEVAIPSLQRAAISGPDGAYRLAGIPAGSYAVQVRHVGDEPLTDSMRFAPSARVARAFTLRRATVLDTVRTQARAVSEKLRVFETHAATKMGAYVSDSSLRLRSGRRLADVLPMLIQDLRIWRTGKQVYVVAPSRGRVLSGFRNASRCISTVYLNGELQWDAQQLGTVLPFSIGELWIDDIAGVEYYGGNAPVPLEYRRTKSDCGTLVLWTRG